MALVSIHFVPFTRDIYFTQRTLHLMDPFCPHGTGVFDPHNVSTFFHSPQPELRGVCSRGPAAPGLEGPLGFGRPSLQLERPRQISRLRPHDDKGLHAPGRKGWVVAPLAGAVWAHLRPLAILEVACTNPNQSQYWSLRFWPTNRCPRAGGDNMPGQSWFMHLVSRTK